jgi:starvation-inducible outer membrane lipoprotein
MRIVLLALAVVALMISGDSAAQTVRCGGKIVEVGMSADEVLRYCGPPTRKEVEEHDVRSGGRVVGVTYLHRWYYDRGFAGKPKVLEFDQDRLIAIK